MLASKQHFGGLTASENWALTETLAHCPPQQDGGVKKKSKTWNFTARVKKHLTGKEEEKIKPNETKES